MDKIHIINKRMAYKYPSSKQHKTDKEPTKLNENKIRKKKVKQYICDALCPTCYEKDQSERMIMISYETLKQRRNAHFRYCDDYTGNECKYSKREFCNNSIVWICTNNKNHTGPVCFGRECINAIITQQFNATPKPQKKTKKPQSYVLYIFYIYFIYIL